MSTQQVSRKFRTNFLGHILLVNININIFYFTIQVKELGEALGPLTGRSLKYCSEPCLRRYLKARNWDVEKAKKMLEESLKWRANYKPEDIRWVREIFHDINKAN